MYVYLLVDVRVESGSCDITIFNLFDIIPIIEWYKSNTEGLQFHGLYRPTIKNLSKLTLTISAADFGKLVDLPEAENAVAELYQQIVSDRQLTDSCIC
jgi:hypothetical protein